MEEAVNTIVNPHHPPPSTPPIDILQVEALYHLFAEGGAISIPYTANRRLLVAPSLQAYSTLPFRGKAGNKTSGMSDYKMEVP
jgi:hypothetical protein